jgi:hypothetical protein
MLEDFTHPHHSLGHFYETFSDYAHIMSCITKIFSHQDEEAISKALEGLEAFVQGEKYRWKLAAELRKIVSDLNKGSKEGKG